MVRLSRIAFAAALGLAACQAPKTPTAHAGGAKTGEVSILGGLDPKTPVAKVNGETLTEADLAEALKKEISREETEHVEKLNQLRRAGMDSLIAKRLVEAKAKAESITPEALIKREVQDKMTEPNDMEVAGVYERAKASGRPLPPLDQVKPDIVKFIKGQKAEEAMKSYFDKLRAEAKVETSLTPLSPPKIMVAADGPSRGDDKAPVTIVEFSDFQCPYCGRAEPTVQRILAEYKGKVRIVFRDFPLPFHEKAQKASEAALCAQDQGKYWEMHDKLFTNQRALDVEQLKGYAKELQLDAGKFDKCLDGGDKAAAVETHKKAGEEAGVTGTPAFFVNGRPLSGAIPYENFKEAIDAELKVAHGG